MLELLGRDPTSWSFVFLLVGLLFCFMGRKIMPVLLVLIGFGIGYTWGSVPLSDLFGAEAWVPWVAGALCAVLAVVLWKLSVFFAGSVIGLYLSRSVFPELADLAHAAIALGFGVLVALFRKPIICFFTALAGAHTIGLSLATLAGSLGLIETVGLVAEQSAGNLPNIIRWTATALFTILGYLFQMRKLED